MNHLHATLEVLSQDKIELIHQKTAEILEKTGISVPNDRVLALASEMGAVVDRKTQVMRIPRAVLNDLIEETRRQGGMNDREFHTGHKLGGNVSTQVYLVDPISRTRRLGVMDDVLKGIALAPHLKNIGKGFATVVPSDVPSRMSDVALYRALYQYVEGGGCTYILTPESARYILEMSKATGYGIFYLLETVSPFQFQPKSLEMALLVAEAGFGMGLAPMVISGASGPITAAGTLTVANAEVLASLFLIRCITGRPAAFYGHGTHNMDLRSMTCSFGNPGQAFFAIASAQMARYYGMWASSNSALTDAILPDFQAGFEKGVTATMSALCGAVAVGCQGIAGADQGFSFEQLVIDDEWLGYLNYLMDGFTVTEETIAAGLIEEVGIGGNFLAEEHTVGHMADSRHTDRLFGRDAWSDAIRDPGKDLLARAHKFVEEKTRGYKTPEPRLSPELMRELDRIYAAAERELGN